MARVGLNLDASAPSVSPQARQSLQLLWWIPLGPIVGFLLGSLILSESWPLWQVIPIALVLAAPFVVGALYGYSAIRHRDRTGWVGLVPEEFRRKAVALALSGDNSRNRVAQRAAACPRRR
jgi:MFS family permease